MRAWWRKLVWRLWGYWNWRGAGQAKVAWWLYDQENSDYKAGRSEIRPEYLHDFSINGTRYAKAAIAMSDEELEAHLALIALEECDSAASDLG